MILKYLLSTRNPIGKLFYRIYKNKKFKSSFEYWEQRYSKGGNSGAGSYKELAKFKAIIINDFVQKNKIDTVIEFGCGDGNQLSLSQYPNYIGFDISLTTINNCIEKFKNDLHKSFFLYNSKAFVDNQSLFRADLSLSLDVIYHLIEDDVFHLYMTHLFQVSLKYVIIYSSNIDREHIFHIKERNFTNWVEINCPGWIFFEKIINKYPYNPNDPTNTSFSDFYIFKKK